MPSPSEPSAPPVVLTIAGSDSSGGAGIQADLKTFAALGCYGLSALTGVVAEVPAKVDRIALLDPEMVAAQIRVVAEAFPIRAAKSGMLGGAAQIAAVIDAWEPLAKQGVPLVVDPVMVATSGRRLLAEDALELLTRQWFPMARLITPNLDEAAVLLGSRASTREEMEAAALALAEKFQTAILLKGGHLEDEQAPDVLVEGKGVHWLEGRRVPGVRTHGTGCTYSAAIAAGLASGLSLMEAVVQGKKYVSAAIAGHHRWNHAGVVVDALDHSAFR